MLGLSKSTDYALIALSYLAERPEKYVSAREIAAAYELPTALLMNLLKGMQARGLLRSSRGTKGGYQIAVDLERTSLFDVVEAIDGSVRLVDCVSASDADCGGDGACRVSHCCPVRGPLRALHGRLVRFLKDVKLSDLVVAGRRIDVPLELLGVG